MIKRVYLFGILAALIFSSLAFLFTKNAEAKVLPQAKIGGQRTVKTNLSGIGVWPYLKDRRNLAISFSRLQNATAVSYSLTYRTRNQQEGAMGGLNLTGASNQSAQIYFGTCSKNDCTPHQGIQNAKLEISYTSKKTGKTHLLKYGINI